MNMNKIRVVIVSQQSMLRQGIEQSLSGNEEIEIAGIEDGNSEVLSSIGDSPPDVALVDIDGPSDSGLTLARRIRQRSPSVAVVVLTSNPSDAQLFQALKAQAVAYLSKEITADELVNIVAAILTSGHLVNTSYEERFRETVEIFQRYRSELEKVM